MTDVDTEVALDDDGRPIFRKRARTEEGRRRLRREAAALSRARHPGVVHLLEHRPDNGRPTLVLRWSGSHTLSTMRTLSVEHAAGILAAVATTVADLHDMGVVHGRLSAEHVVLGEGGRPLLCGFGGAEPEADRPGSTRSHEESEPSARRTDRRPRPADDVAALGHLLHQLIAGDLESEPIPDRRRFPLGRGRWAGFQRRSLLTLADQASAEDAAIRPTARALAAAIHQAVPNARLPSSVEVPQDADRRQGGAGASHPARRARPARSRKGAVLVGAAAAAALLLLVAQQLGPLDAPGRATFAPVEPADDRPASRQVRTSTPDAVRPGPTTDSEAPASGPCPATPPPRADVDGDGCDETLSVEGSVVTAGSRQFTVGRPGDLLAVGDWDCDGDSTVAVARPTTREVFVFDRWAAAEKPVTVRPAAAGVHATDARAVDPDGDGCQELLVTDGAGATAVVPLDGAP